MIASGASLNSRLNGGVSGRLPRLLGVVGAGGEGFLTAGPSLDGGMWELVEFFLSWARASAKSFSVKSARVTAAVRSASRVQMRARQAMRSARKEAFLRHSMTFSASCCRRRSMSWALVRVCSLGEGGVIKAAVMRAAGGASVNHDLPCVLLRLCQPAPYSLCTLPCC
jgi:hypothetical protein